VAEIVEKVGNIFTTTCDVVTVTVNTVGQMGAGIALEAKHRYPDMEQQYSGLCETGDFAIGQLILWRQSQPKILLFPTKQHWRYPSRMEFVTAGLDKLAATYRDRGISTIALPHLGTSHGGLSWADVKREIELRLSPLPGLYVELWEYDAEATDPLFLNLRERLHGLDPTQVRDEIDVKMQAAKIIVEILEQAEIASMSVFHSAPGLGPVALHSLYRHAMAGHPEGTARQLDLGMF
jgi:O-acetyl-ADP-ribose deacetylase (regulator of RNase III)